MEADDLVVNSQFIGSIFKRIWRLCRLLEKQLVNSKPLSFWTLSTVMPFADKIRYNLAWKTYGGKVDLFHVSAQNPIAVILVNGGVLILLQLPISAAAPGYDLYVDLNTLATVLYLLVWFEFVRFLFFAFTVQPSLHITL